MGARPARVPRSGGGGGRATLHGTRRPTLALAGPTRFSHAFEAPGYRWLWANALCTSMTLTVELLSQGWLILVLTQSPFWVGLAAGLRGASQTLFSLAGGAFADYVDRRRLLVITQAAAAIMALAVALLVLSHAIRLWHMLLYVALAGCAFAVSKPTTNGLMYDLVGEQRLLNANAFLFMAGSIVRILGALLGGLVIARLGVGQNYLLVVAAYGIGLGCLVALRSPQTIRRTAEPLIASVREGLRYAVGTREIRWLLWLSLTIEAFGFSYQFMLPVMARDVLKVGALGLGYLTAMGGVGQFAATLHVAARGDVARKGTLMIVAAIGFGGGILCFSLSPWFLVSLAVIAVVGYMGSNYDATMSTVLQVSASEEMRGRVLGLYYATIGLNQLGALATGAVASALGLPIALAIGGGIVVACALGLLPGLRTFNAQPSSAVPPDP